MEDDWKAQYKKWKSLKPFQIKLLEEGPKTQSQAWLINNMWCEWAELKVLKNTNKTIISTKDPWE